MCLSIAFVIHVILAVSNACCMDENEKLYDFVHMNRFLCVLEIRSD